MKVLLQLGEDFSKVFAVLDPRFFLGQVAGDLEAKAGDLKGQERLQVHLFYLNWLLKCLKMYLVLLEHLILPSLH